MEEEQGNVAYAMKQYIRLKRVLPDSALLGYARLTKDGFSQSLDQAVAFVRDFGRINPVVANSGWIAYGNILYHAVQEQKEGRRQRRIKIQTGLQIFV